MSSNSDSMSGAPRAPKRSASQSLCDNGVCTAFGKTLGNGYCQGCCISRGVPWKPPKIQRQPPAPPVVATVDPYFINKVREAVKSVTFNVLFAWIVQKGVLLPKINCPYQKEDLILLMAEKNMEYDVEVAVDSYRAVAGATCPKY